MSFPTFSLHNPAPHILPTSAQPPLPPPPIRPTRQPRTIVDQIALDAALAAAQHNHQVNGIDPAREEAATARIIATEAKKSERRAKRRALRMELAMAKQAQPQLPIPDGTTPTSATNAAGPSASASTSTSNRNNNNNQNPNLVPHLNQYTLPPKPSPTAIQIAGAKWLAKQKQAQAIANANAKGGVQKKVKGKAKANAANLARGTAKVAAGGRGRAGIGGGGSAEAGPSNSRHAKANLLTVLNKGGTGTSLSLDPRHLPPLLEIQDPVLKAQAFMPHGGGGGRIDQHQWLEWDGDAYLHTFITGKLINDFVHAHVGPAAGIRSLMESNCTFHHLANHYGFRTRLLANGIAVPPTPPKKGILSNTFEAYIGALHQESKGNREMEGSLERWLDEIFSPKVFLSLKDKRKVIDLDDEDDEEEDMDLDMDVDVDEPEEEREINNEPSGSGSGQFMGLSGIPSPAIKSINGRRRPLAKYRTPRKERAGEVIIDLTADDDDQEEEEDQQMPQNGEELERQDQQMPQEEIKEQQHKPGEAEQQQQHQQRLTPMDGGQIGGSSGEEESVDLTV